MMILFVSAVLLIVGAFTLVMLWHHPEFFRRRRRLPPGSMGWPYIGQTLQLYSQNPDTFFSDKQKRYGDIFKLHFLGCSSIMIANPEAAKFVLSSQLFKPTFPPSKESILGRNALFFHQGEYHARLRKVIQSSFLPKAISGIIAYIDKIALNNLKTWEGSNILTFQQMKKYAFDVGIHSIFGALDTSYTEEIKKHYHILEKGYNSLPINLPGSLFDKSMKARKKLSQIFSKIIAERRATIVPHKDLLQSLMAARDARGEGLKEEQITDNVIGVLFAARDTTATVLTWVVKFLSEYPALLDAVTAEQEGIEETKNKGEILTLADTKKMPLTARVIQETLRLATVLSFTFREAVEDVEYKGYLIPKGWKVMPLFRNIHHNPEYFPDPHKFDPSRFEVPPKPNTFMPFGKGVHSCPGNQLAQIEILIFIHHLTTKFRWEILGTDNEIEYSPFPIPKQRLPMRVSSKYATPQTGSIIPHAAQEDETAPSIFCTDSYL